MVNVPTFGRILENSVSLVVVLLILDGSHYWTNPWMVNVWYAFLISWWLARWIVLAWSSTYHMRHVKPLNIRWKFLLRPSCSLATALTQFARVQKISLMMCWEMWYVFDMRFPSRLFQIHFHSRLDCIAPILIYVFIEMSEWKWGNRHGKLQSIHAYVFAQRFHRWCHQLVIYLPIGYIFT